MITTQEVQTIFNQVKDDLSKIVPISDNIVNTVFINNRKRALGTCQYRKIGDTPFYTIFISKYLLNTNKKLIQDVIAHELVHTIKNCMNHSVLFTRYANIVNKTTDYNVDIKYSGTEFNPPKKYKITCKKCGRTFYRNRLPKNRTGLTHMCGGDIIIEQI